MRQDVGLQLELPKRLRTEKKYDYSGEKEISSKSNSFSYGKGISSQRNSFFSMLTLKLDTSLDDKIPRRLRSPENLMTPVCLLVQQKTIAELSLRVQNVDSST